MIPKKEKLDEQTTESAIAEGIWLGQEEDMVE